MSSNSERVAMMCSPVDTHDNTAYFATGRNVNTTKLGKQNKHALNRHMHGLKTLTTGPETAQYGRGGIIHGMGFGRRRAGEERNHGGE